MYCVGVLLRTEDGGVASPTSPVQTFAVPFAEVTTMAALLLFRPWQLRRTSREILATERGTADLVFHCWLVLCLSVLDVINDSQFVYSVGHDSVRGGINPVYGPLII